MFLLIIEFDKQIYEKNWTGDVDQILSYDSEFGRFTVRSLLDGTQRTHSTTLDCSKVSFNMDFSKTDDECIKYLIHKGISHLSQVPSRFYELINPTEDNLEKLIRLLRKIDSGDVEIKVFEDSSDGSICIDCSEKDTVPYEIERLACDTLISPEGKCNWKNITKVKNSGFDVFAGEKDSFGWLTGCIKTDGGIIVYG